MKARSKKGIIATTGLIAIIAFSFFAVSDANQIVSFYYSKMPPMSKCGTLPSAEPSFLASQLTQIEGNPVFTQIENGSSYLYATNSQMVELYFNGTQFNILQVAFVHLDSTRSEDIIYVQVFQNGTETFSHQNINVGCFEPGGSRG